MRGKTMKFFLILTIPILTLPITLKTTFQIAPPKYIPGKEPSGVAYEILERIDEELKGIDVVWDGKYRNIGEVVDLLERCEIDLFVGMAKTGRRKKELAFSEYPLYSLRHALLLRKESKGNLKVVTIGGTRSEEVLRETVEGNFEVFKLRDIEKAIEGLIDGKFDGVFYNSLSLGYYSRILGSEFTLRGLLSRKYYHYIAFSRCVSKKIIEEFNRVLWDLLRSGEVKEILEKYSLLEFVKPANYVELANIDWPPYEFVEDGSWKGIDAELVSRVLRDMGYEVEILRMNWSRIMEYLRKGIIDGTFSLIETPDRREFLYFSDEPISSGIDGFLHRRSVEVDPEKPLLCGYVRGYAYKDLLEGTNFVPVPVSDDETGVKLLAAGRLDLFLVNNLVGKYYSRKYGLDLEFTPASEVRLYRLALSKVDEFHERILEEFSRRLRIFKKTKDYEEILEEYGLTYEDVWGR